MELGKYLDITGKRKVILVKMEHDDLMKIWKRCSITANYGAGYLSSSYLGKRDVMNSASMILNELIENAAKYSDEKDGDIEMTIIISEEEAVFQVDNTVNAEQYGKFRAFADELVHSADVKALYVEKLQSFKDEQKLNAGIGLLSLLNFFNPQIGFRFQPIQEENKYRVSVQAAMPIDGSPACR